MKQNWRPILPRRLITIILCTAYLLTYLLDLYIIYLDIPVPKNIGAIRMPLLVIASALYGYYRVRAFHPFYSRKYREWLCLIPWSVDKPLLQGPVHLIWADLITLVPLTVLAYSNYSISAPVPVIVFLSVYLVMICITFVADRASLVVLCLFLAPFTFYPFANRYFAVLVLIVIYIICWVVLHQFLRGFPWNTKYWKADMVKELREKAISQRVIGWPFRYLNIYEASGISVFGAFVLSLLLTWWLHVIFWIAGGPHLFIGLLIMLPICVALFRAIIYAGIYRPPISLLGRIFTGRLIIPGYDMIFIAPIYILLAGTLLPFALGLLGVNLTLIIEISFFMIFFLAFSLPPNLREWRLTGAHRISRHVQKIPPRPVTPQNQAIVTFFSRKFKSSK
ncbi:MAG: hypothetical protein ACYSWZ_03785 [Planctomycetota bacterium]|jgi:hypothetical protein